jgi:hypothetical protein
MTEISKFNNISQQLQANNGIFIGRIESSKLNSITANLTASQNCTISIYQYPTSQSPLSAYSNVYTKNITITSPLTFQCAVVDKWFHVVVNNTSSSVNNITLNTYFQNQNATSLIEALQIL